MLVTFLVVFCMYLQKLNFHQWQYAFVNMALINFLQYGFE